MIDLTEDLDGLDSNIDNANEFDDIGELDGNGLLEDIELEVQQ